MSYQHRLSVRIARDEVTPLRASLTALAAACLLAACGSDVALPPSASGGLGSAASTGTTPPTSTLRATAGTLTTVGQTANDLGGTIASTPVPGMSPGATQGLGGAVTATGSTLTSVANALSNGVGQMGTIPDPVGATAAGLGPAISSTGGVIAGAAATVDALGTGNGSALSPITAPVANTLYTVANGVDAAGEILGNTAASPSVQQVTQPISGAITPLVVTLGQATQTVGTTTGIGTPVANALGQVGGALRNAGAKIVGTTPNQAGVNLGQLVSTIGATVTNAGGLVDPNAPNGALPIPGLIRSLGGSSSTPTAHQPVYHTAPNSPNPLGTLTSVIGTPPAR
jgi:hypothetical protein